MLFRKYKENRYVSKNIRVPISDLIQKIDQIRETGAFLVLTPKATGYNWKGVNNATLGLFRENTMELPQYFSQSPYTAGEWTQIINHIKSLNFDTVVLSGFPDYFAHIAKKLNANKISVSAIYHGFFSELEDNKLQTGSLHTLLKLAKDGVIHKIGFIKKGMAETIKEIWEIPTSKLLLKTPIPALSKSKKQANPLKIGIFGNNHFRKNIPTQVAGAILIKNSTIHVRGPQDFEYLDLNKRIVYHSEVMEHPVFLKMCQSMDINLHISYSESWGQITLESMAAGVPCLIANHSDILDYDDYLKSKLVVSDYDNSFAIAEKINEVLNSKHELSQLCINYVHKVNSLADDKITEFLKD